MTILHINTHYIGGAGIAATRLHNGLLQRGIDSKLLTLRGEPSISHIKDHYIFPQDIGALSSILKKDSTKKNNNEREKQRARKEFLAQVPKEIEAFTFSDSNIDITEHPVFKSAEIIHLHFVSRFIDFPTFFRKAVNKKLVWTLHDMNPFTGGCHYPKECLGYQDNCTQCPQILNTNDPDYAEKNLKNKIELFKAHKPDITIVTPSSWLGACSSKSILFRDFGHEVIPNGLNTEIYKPIDKNACCRKLNIPIEKNILLFVSQSIQNYRKGFRLLLQAINLLKNKQDIIICSIGSFDEDIRMPGDIAHIPFGKINDEFLMSLIYNAADVLIIPSIEDNLPNTVIEGLCCGIPVIGFPIGGIVDMIKTGVNGIICNEVSAESLSKAISQYNDGDYIFSSSKIRRMAKKVYDQNIQAGRFIDLYNSIL